jgi:hypothetical protein
MRPSALLVLLAACSATSGGAADAPVAGAPDAPAGAPDAPGAQNPAVLWLAGINGSEINLELIDSGPPPAF